MNDTSTALPPDEMLREYYHLHFAGRPRLTRDVTLLGQLIELASRNQNATLAQLWRTELQHIESEQRAAGTAGRQMAQRLEDGQILANRVRFLQLDAGLFEPAAIDCVAAEAAVQDARALATAVQPLSAPTQPHSGRAEGLVGALQDVVDEGRRAVAAARAARTSGTDLGRARARVRAAQLLQHTFDTRVAERPGNVVRPERIGQLADGLSQVAQDLRACAVAGPEHAANCQALAQQAAHWRAQAQRASALRRQHTPDELAHSLAAEADAVLEAAQEWTDGAGDAAPEALLRTGLALTDRMDEIRRQLEGVPLIFGMAEHRHTLGTVTDGLAYLSALLERHVPQGQPHRLP